MIIDFSHLCTKYDLAITGVIHIGAHHGQEAQDYIAHNIKELVFFEPLAEPLAHLVTNLQKYSDLAEIEVFPYALGNKEETVEMYVSNRDQMCSSVLKPKVVLEQYPDITFDKKESVDMVRLQDCDINFDKFNFLNIDVQGYELEVLKGAGKEVLDKIDYIYTEVNRAEVYEDTPHIDEIDSFLSEFGFERVETDWIGDTWGDAFYIKK